MVGSAYDIWPHEEGTARPLALKPRENDVDPEVATVISSRVTLTKPQGSIQR